MERLLVQQIQALGVRVEPREGDYATYTERMKSGNFQFAFDNWIADYPDAENFLLQYVKSNWEPGPNDSMYENPKIEELYKKIARMDSGPERVKLIREARDIIVEDCPKIYLAYQSEHELIQPWSTGQYFPAVGNELVKYAGVDPHLRTELESQWNRSNLWPLPLFAGFFVLGVAPAAAAIRQRRNRKVRREKRP
jgi:ABC-type oligopeptide transport system substrate-binding subunit